jgi:hypothetical protein
MLKSGWKVFKTFNPTARLITAIAGPILMILILIVAYGWVKNTFFGGAEAVRQQANGVVQEEQAEAAEHTGGVAVEKTIERAEYHTRQETIVREGLANVDRATTARDAHAAGASALCSLHDGCTRPPEAPAVRELCPADPEGGDAPRTDPC